MTKREKEIRHEKINRIIAILIKIVSVLFGIWLSIWIMLFGGIVQAIEGFKIGNTSMGIMGVIKAVFFETGTIPAYVLWLGADIYKDC